MKKLRRLLRGALRRLAQKMRQPPARFPNIFIVTYGRSGSTLIQGVMNSIPGYLVRGENENVAGKLMEMRDGLATWAGGPSKATDPWYGRENFREKRLRPILRNTLDAILLTRMRWRGIRCYGFKEIRYTVEDVEEKIAFLRWLYPGAAIIFNTRKPADVVQSEFQREQSIAHFEALNAKFASLAQEPGCFLIAYEDVVARNQRLRELFAFLGEAYNDRAISDVLKIKHSFHDLENRFRNEAPFFARVEDQSLFERFQVLGIARKGSAVEIRASVTPAPGLQLSDLSAGSSGCLDMHAEDVGVVTLRIPVAEKNIVLTMRGRPAVILRNLKDL